MRERYRRIPEGLSYFMTLSHCYPVFFTMMIINLILISIYFKNEKSYKIFNSIFWILLFDVIYILFLPLGGYRHYRPFIVRYDTVIPITIGFFFIYGSSTYFLLKNIQTKFKFIYIIIIISFSTFLTLADEPHFDRNQCERESLIKIATSNDTFLKLDKPCTVLSWEVYQYPHQSELNSLLLQRWNITKKPTYYCN